MQYCVGKGFSESDYKVEANGLTLGLWPTYKDRPGLFAAVCMMTTAPFEYEAGSLVPTLQRIGQLHQDQEGYLTDTLYTTVGGKLIMSMLRDMAPDEMFYFMGGFNLSHLPIVRFYKTVENLNMVMKARMWAYNNEEYATEGKKVLEAVNARYRNSLH
jgi:hypothetical protein